ncbi:hypothetical protein AAU57_14750 [Nonlabens sp. YIK11]|nr:hypothetical protein AAU57_14750 [Nonlabens sp. YIK11]
MPSKNDLSSLKKPKKENILPKPKKEPALKKSRKVKGFYISDSVREKFEQLVLVEKQRSGKNSPELVEEALNLLFDKYNFKGLNI